MLSIILLPYLLHLLFILLLYSYLCSCGYGLPFSVVSWQKCPLPVLTVDILHTPGWSHHYLCDFASVHLYADLSQPYYTCMIFIATIKVASFSGFQVKWLWEACSTQNLYSPWKKTTSAQCWQAQMIKKGSKGYRTNYEALKHWWCKTLLKFCLEALAPGTWSLDIGVRLARHPKFRRCFV